MPETRINKTIDEQIEAKTQYDYPELDASEKQKDVVGRIFDLFQEARRMRDKQFEYFDGRTITQYIDDCVRRFVTNIDEREDIEDWQARIHQPFTRNKIQAVLGKVIDALPIAEIYNRGDEDILKAEILNTMLEYAEDVDNAEEFFIYMIEEALVKGTAIGYEGVQTKTKSVRDVVKYKNGDDITVKESYIKTTKLSSTIVPLEEFYPSSVSIRRISDMPYCFWRKQIPYKQFAQDFQNYDLAKYVRPHQPPIGNQVPLQFYQDYISADIIQGNVEVLRYYNQDTDEYVIVANGIWINPLQGDVISPLPFNHKQLPFWEMRYDVLGDFFYGKSLADKLKTMQDTLNVLHNMLLDQSFLSIFPPILTAGADNIEDDFLRPGRRIEVDTQGLSLQESYMKLDIGTPTSWHQYILEYTKKIIEESSVDSVSQGVAGVGGRTTATEIRGAADGVASILGLFARFVKIGAQQRARLRVRNIIQFYLDPSCPIVEGLHYDGDDINKAFNVITVDSTAMTPGDRGTKIIEIYKNSEDMPTKTEQAVNARVSEIVSNKKVKRIAILPEYLRDSDFDIRIIANPKSETSKDLNRALEIQFQQTILTLHGDLVDRKELAAEMIQAFGKDPMKILKEEVINPQPVQPQGAVDPTTQAIQQAQGQTNSQSMMPNQGGDNSQNVIKGATGVGGEGLDLSSLMGK